MAKQELTTVRESRPAEVYRPLSLFDEMERWLDEFFPRGWLRPAAWAPDLEAGTLPQIDVIDREEDILVRAAVPGYSKDDIEVTATDDSVTLRGSRKEEHKEEKGDYYCHEIRMGNFTRTLQLPAAVDGSRAEAKFRDGMLELVLPKQPQAKRQKIEIH